jgi:hypothetical protein
MLSGQTAEFPASYDLTTKIISTVVCGGLLVMAVALQSLIIGCISLVSIAVAYAYSPRRYTFSGRSIMVKRLIGNVRVPLDDVREARRVTSDDLRGCIRLFGSGGMFGYYGLFRTTRLGRSMWYVTNRKNAVVVIGGSKTTLFSPDDVDAFLGTIRESVSIPPGLEPQSSVAGPPQAHRTVSLAVILIGVVVVLPGIAVVLAMFYSPGPPSYTLSSDSLTIHDRFYPLTVKPDSVDVANIRVVDLPSEPEWRPVLRTGGFANFHYRSGHFRAANGRSVRLYLADGQRLVLLPPRGDGTPILLDVKDPESFVQDVRREWASR